MAVALLKIAKLVLVVMKTRRTIAHSGRAYWDADEVVVVGNEAIEVHVVVKEEVVVVVVIRMMSMMMMMLTAS